MMRCCGSWISSEAGTSQSGAVGAEDPTWKATWCSSTRPSR